MTAIRSSALGSGGVRRIEDRGAQMDATAAATWILAREAILGSTTHGRGAFYFDPADYPGRSLRLRLGLLSNAVAPVSNFLAEMYPVASLSGAAAAVTITRGTVVAGSGVTITAPTANTEMAPVSATFAMPAADYYVLTITNSATMAANSSVVVRLALDVV